MKTFVFSIYDSVGRVYSAPFYAPLQALAVRDFATLANADGSRIAAHSADFTLFQLGAFDDETGTFEIESPQINLGLATNFKKENSHA